jgi:hypothetical protein
MIATMMSLGALLVCLAGVLVACRPSWFVRTTTVPPVALDAASVQPVRRVALVTIK